MRLNDCLNARSRGRRNLCPEGLFDAQKGKAHVEPYSPTLDMRSRSSFDKVLCSSLVDVAG
ncbi:hypothetical protein PoMZ_00775 [Pyricularia oryzae]|uniref:Uncharacterized protein n=1 Tax=Pyricularia oryzae TaxID=318829 RepID=A0A4P7N0V1_PYROR|nr:hypothetical protein PoMZ_00775 [Pyricularia oryzae]